MATLPWREFAPYFEGHTYCFDLRERRRTKGLVNTGGCARDCAPSANIVPFTMRTLNRSRRLNCGGLGGPGDHRRTPEKDGRLPPFAWMLTSWWILELKKKFREPICDWKRVIWNHFFGVRRPQTTGLAGSQHPHVPSRVEEYNDIGTMFGKYKVGQEASSKCLAIFRNADADSSRHPIFGLECQACCLAGILPQKSAGRGYGSTSSHKEPRLDKTATMSYDVFLL